MDLAGAAFFVVFLAAFLVVFLATFLVVLLAPRPVTFLEALFLAAFLVDFLAAPREAAFLVVFFEALPALLRAPRLFLLPFLAAILSSLSFANLPVRVVDRLPPRPAVNVEAVLKFRVDYVDRTITLAVLLNLPD